jgi:hypothetical protein
VILTAKGEVGIGSISINYIDVCASGLADQFQKELSKKRQSEAIPQIFNIQSSIFSFIPALPD